MKMKVEGKDWKSLFALDSYTGQLTTAEILDRLDMMMMLLTMMMMMLMTVMMMMMLLMIIIFINIATAILMIWMVNDHDDYLCQPHRHHDAS